MSSRWPKQLRWVRDAAATEDGLLLPDDLTGKDPVSLADGRSRLGVTAGTAQSLRRVVDRTLADTLGAGGAVRLGDMLLRVTPDRQRHVNPDIWRFIVEVIRSLDDEQAARLLAELINPDLIRMHGLDRLAMLAGVDSATVRDTWTVLEGDGLRVETPPRRLWPGWADRMADGAVRQQSGKVAE